MSDLPAPGPAGTGPVVAVLGGGQLGRMLGLAGIPLGVRTRFLDPSPDAPAAVVGPVVTGALDDPDALDALVAGADVVTYEWEGVPAAVAQRLAARIAVHPPAGALAVAQDRLAEKRCFAHLGIPTAEYRVVDARDDLERAGAQLGWPVVLKTRSGGYDGKGQALVRGPAEVDAAWARLGAVPLVAEALVPFDRELSVIGVRGQDGTHAVWAITANDHRDGILRVSRAPAPDLDPDVARAAGAIVADVLDHLDHVGVACVELFETAHGLLANELAPRVHNSGHWTIEGAVTSQFENHLRAICGWPIGATDPVGAVAMVNCLGRMPDAARVLAVPGAHLHDYGKQPRPGRKVGHVTLCGDHGADLEPRLARVRAIVEAAGA